MACDRAGRKKEAPREENENWAQYANEKYIYWRAGKGFPCGSDGKESACNAGDLGSIPGLERSPGEGKGYPLQYSGLENSVDCIVSSRGHEESDMTEQLSLTHTQELDRTLGDAPVSLFHIAGIF